MAVDFSQVDDVAFAAFGRPATYCPPDDVEIACTVVVTTPATDAPMLSTGFGLSPEAQEAALIADVRRSEVARPAKGARLVIEGLGTYEIVRNPELNSEKVVWQLPLREIA
jgi:hypothetical protein